MQHQVMQVKSNGQMSLTRMAQPFKVAFKKARGMKRSASNLDVLIEIGIVYNEFNMVEKFWEYINKPHCMVDGKPLVTPEMLLAVEAKYQGAN